MTNSESSALIELGIYLKEQKYHFISVTPETHKRVSNRPQKPRPHEEIIYNWSRDLFGWSREVKKSLVPKHVIELLRKASAIDDLGSYIKSKVRYSSLEDLILVHSAFPTDEEDSVFFGPDTYRFIRFIKAHAKPVNCLIDLGAGTGAGGLILARHFLSHSGFKTAFLADINEKALHYSEINSRINQIEATHPIESNLLNSLPQGAKLIIANPPFMIDDLSRSYRHGGEQFGTELSLDIAKASLNYLNKSGGQFLLYTGAPIIEGRDILKEALLPLLKSDRINFSYEEIDPDLYGEELSTPAYHSVERIAGVGLSVSLDT